MTQFSKQEVVNDQYYISTTEDKDGENNFSTLVIGYHNKRVMWSKVYKTVRYKTQKEAEEGHKALKQEFS